MYPYFHSPHGRVLVRMPPPRAQPTGLPNATPIRNLAPLQQNLGDGSFPRPPHFPRYRPICPYTPYGMPPLSHVRYQLPSKSLMFFQQYPQAPVLQNVQNQEEEHRNEIGSVAGTEYGQQTIFLEETQMCEASELEVSREEVIEETITSGTNEDDGEQTEERILSSGRVSESSDSPRQISTDEDQQKSDENSMDNCSLEDHSQQDQQSIDDPNMEFDIDQAVASIEKSILQNSMRRASQREELGNSGKLQDDDNLSTCSVSFQIRLFSY